MRQHADVPSLWLKICMGLGLVLVALSASRCTLRWYVASAERQRAATECLYAERCVLGSGVPIPEGKTCRDVDEGKVSPTPGYVAPASCMKLWDAREQARLHVAAARPVLKTGGSDASLEEDLKVDVKNLKSIKKEMSK
jgi:hypothetical protein